jgi:LPXTG-site transpeptidase (sortase) family protein
MRPYSYVKANTEALFIQHQVMREKGRKAVSASFLFVGLSLFSYVGGYYYLWGLKENQIASKPGLVHILDSAPASAFTAQVPTKPNNSGVTEPGNANAAIDPGVVFPTFGLNIPKLNIKEAVVTTDVLSNNEDIYKPVLLKSLAHYKGSAYPGTDGNTIIYGHSILPTFYNPKNYLSIFTTLDTLNATDQIHITWGEATYTYVVEGMEVVDPKDTRVLRYHNGKTLTLVTCEPPGFTTKRLLVFTRLAE